MAAARPPPDEKRVILHFDVDCMYAQTEELRNPRLVGRPLAVTQKYLIVTCNYPARAAGVTKLMATTEGLKKCPGLILVSGEDLTPYRAASKAILSVLNRFGPAERLGMDEVFVDVTGEVEARLATWGGRPPPGLAWCGHVHSGSAELIADSRHRPQDLRAPPGRPRAGEGGRYQQQQQQQQQEDQAQRQGGGEQNSQQYGQEEQQEQEEEECWDADGGQYPAWAARLMVGSAIAQEARAAVRSETGFRCSAGIACNKLLAKLVSGVHKPDDQTILPPPEAWAFLEPLPVRALPGVGYRLAQQLAQLGVDRVAALRAVGMPRLVELLGDTQGPTVHALCRGIDPVPVRPSGPPKSITVEDSFAGCSGWDAVRAVLQVLVPDLLSRVHEEWLERRRRPHTLTIKWRHKGAGWARQSASAPMPLPGPLAAPPGAREAEAVTRAALQLLRQHLPAGFNLSLLNAGVANIKDEGPGPGAFDTGAFDRLLGGTAGGAGQLSRGRLESGGVVASGAAADGAAGRGGGGGGELGAELGGLPAWARGLAAGGGPGASQSQQQAAPAADRAAATAAAAAAQAQRRDYRRSPAKGAGAVAMSKSDERRLREQGFQPQQQQQQQPVSTPGLRRPASAAAADHDPQHPPAKLQRTGAFLGSSSGYQGAAASAFDLVSIGGQVVGSVEIVEDAEWCDDEEG